MFDIVDRVCLHIVYHVHFVRLHYNANSNHRYDSLLLKLFENENEKQRKQQTQKTTTNKERARVGNSCSWGGGGRLGTWGTISWGLVARPYTAVQF